MTAERTVRGVELEHGLPRLLCQGHEAAVLLQQRKTLRIAPHVGGFAGILIEDLFAVDGRNLLDPALGGTHGIPHPLRVLHDDVAGRSELPCGKRNVDRPPRPLASQYPIAPVHPPSAERGAKITQTLKRIQIRGQRYHHLLCGEECRAVDRSEIRAHVNQHDCRVHLLCRRLNGSPRQRDHTEGPPGVVGETLVPLRIELALGEREPEIADQKPERSRQVGIAHRLHVHRTEIAHTFEEGAHRSIDRP